MKITLDLLFWVIFIISAGSLVAMAWWLRHVLSKDLSEVVIAQNNLMFSKLDVYKDMYEQLGKKVSDLKDKCEDLERKHYKTKEDIETLFEEIKKLV